MMRLFGAAILLVIFAIPAIMGPPMAFFIIALIILPTCLYELYRVGLGENAKLLGRIGLLGSFPYIYYIYMHNIALSFFLICGLSLIITAAGLFLFEKGKATAMDINLAISGLIYPLALLSFWVLLRNDIDGRFWMLFGIICTFGADTGAYYTGKNFGRHRLAPILSPKKTVEGLLGGLATSVIAGTLLYVLYNRFLPLELPCPLWIVPIIAGAVSLLDLMGDLSASLYKRQFQVKDMGNLIPGHGGMLDRMDGVIPVGIFLYFVIQVIR